MKARIAIKTIFVGMVVVLTLVSGCNDKNKTARQKSAAVKNDPGLAGTWLQTMVGGQDISGAGAHVVIKGNTLTMDAPGCRISGNYTTSGKKLDFVITSIDGPRCAKDEKTGGGGSVNYTIKDDTMTWEIPGRGAQGIKKFKRIGDGLPLQSSPDNSHQE